MLYVSICTGYNENNKPLIKIFKNLLALKVHYKNSKNHKKELTNCIINYNVPHKFIEIQRKHKNKYYMMNINYLYKSNYNLDYNSSMVIQPLTYDSIIKTTFTIDIIYTTKILNFDSFNERNCDIYIDNELIKFTNKYRFKRKGIFNVYFCLKNKN